jgi:D-sedoheptulose 7-phosphate isomerase
MAGSIAHSPEAYLSGLAEVLPRVDQRAISRLAEMLYRAWSADRRVYVFGNGGSASTAGHWVCDLVKNTATEGRGRMQVLSLADNLAMLSALGNDISYDDVFRFPLAAYAREGDIAVAISASGNSPNLLRACEWAKEHGIAVVALTGFAGGSLKDLADLHVNIPSDNYGIIEDLHLAVGHIVSQMLKARAGEEAVAGPRQSGQRI